MVRFARASRTWAAAEAMSGLLASAVEMILVSVGSLNLPHQRLRSRVGEATGNPAAFFQSAGNETLPCATLALGPQPSSPIRAMLDKNTKQVDLMANLEEL